MSSRCSSSVTQVRVFCALKCSCSSTLAAVDRHWILSSMPHRSCHSVTLVSLMSEPVFVVHPYKFTINNLHASIWHVPEISTSKANKNRHKVIFPVHQWAEECDIPHCHSKVALADASCGLHYSLYFWAELLRGMVRIRLRLELMLLFKNTLSWQIDVDKHKYELCPADGTEKCSVCLVACLAAIK